MIKYTLLGHKSETTDGEKIWYIAEYSGLVMEIDLKTNCLKCIWKIPDFPLACAYRLIYYYEKKLFFFPFTQGSIYIYNLISADYSRVDVMCNGEYMTCIQREGYIYAFGAKKIILKICIEDYTVEYINIFLAQADASNLPSKMFWSKCFMKENIIYVPVQERNMVIVISHDDKISCVYLGENIEIWNIANIAVMNNKIYAIYGIGKANDIQVNISEYDLDGNMFSNRVAVDTYSYSTYQFIDAGFYNGKWIVMPFGRNQLLLQDIHCDEILYEIDHGTDMLLPQILGLFWCSVWMDNNIYCSINQTCGEVYMINTCNYHVDNKKLLYEEITEKDQTRYFADAMQINNFMSETEGGLDLKGYLQFICCK